MLIWIFSKWCSSESDQLPLFFVFCFENPFNFHAFTPGSVVWGVWFQFDSSLIPFKPWNVFVWIPTDPAAGTKRPWYVLPGSRHQSVTGSIKIGWGSCTAGISLHFTTVWCLLSSIWFWGGLSPPCSNTSTRNWFYWLESSLSKSRSSPVWACTWTRFTVMPFERKVIQGEKWFRTVLCLEEKEVKWSRCGKKKHWREMLPSVIYG